MNRLALWLDNAILVKHARSRLRLIQLLPSLAVVMVLGVCIMLMGYQYNGLLGGQAFGGLMTLQLVILAIMGASQVGSSVGKARESGILDFHRASPMPPFSEALGFFFGAPIREYLMFAATLPMTLVCIWMGWPSFTGTFQLMGSLVLVAWTLHAIALLNALSGKGGKSGNRAIIGLVILLIFGSTAIVYGFFQLAEAIEKYPTGHFFELELPWLLVMAIDLLPAIGFFLVASTRRLASERAHPLSKSQAIAALATGAVILLGGIWTIEGDFYWTLVVLYVLILGSIILATAITPGRDEFIKGVRKAAKEGRKYPSAWSDRGLNRIGLFCLCGLVLVASTFAWRLIEKPVPWAAQAGQPSYSLPIAIGVLVVAYYGLALQFFQLRFGKRGSVFLALFLFAAWLLPLALGAIAAASYDHNRTPDSPPDSWSPAIASLSPIFGITISSGLGNIPSRDRSRFAALMPALVFALLFNNLVTSTRRRIEKEIHPDPATDPSAEIKPEPDELAEPAMAT
jgi:hypothetical protein